FQEATESLEAQRVALPTPAPLVVAMERTGSLEVTVRSVDVPLEGARVTVSPQVRWIGAEPAPFPWGTWERTSDPWGRARLDDLPPGDAVSVDATHESGTTKRRWTYVVKITSGQTTDL